MVDSVDDKKKVGNVTTANRMDDIRKADTVSTVKSTAQVSGVNSAIDDPRKPTREMTSAEREHMLAMVREEASAMFANSKLSKEQTEAIELAVQSTIDAGIIISDEDA